MVERPGFRSKALRSGSPLTLSTSRVMEKGQFEAYAIEDIDINEGPATEDQTSWWPMRNMRFAGALMRWAFMKI